MPVFIAKHVIPYKEFKDWIAVFEIEQSNYSQTDINLAYLCDAFSKANFKDSKVKLSTFLPFLKEEEKELTQEEIDIKIKCWGNSIRIAKGLK